ncbi:hypothetical protein GQ53DRAFT_861482 [Thozetella sp. PMI_491]|nr:hypothetical protein GQ53DRAFT_861482 [Thozetella sp. PMI_491]
MFVLDNIQDGEEVHQRCVLISGRRQNAANDGFVEIETTDDAGQVLFPEQRWPMCQGWFKGLVMLAPGANRLVFRSGDDMTTSSEIRVRYIPLLQTPPLHLAIMVAKDSPLLMDCPPRKHGAISGAHSSLDAAIAKFRMTAYMWQALTAEDLRAHGLGRRSFRLEEEWTVDTLSQSYLYGGSGGEKMSSTAKIHLIRVDKTVAELRDASLAQQNPHGSDRDGLHRIFSEALAAHGAPFHSEAQPVVAGLILDAHYDASNDMILAHAALGAHNPRGLSLGIFGSHLSYAWPRFMEEVGACLTDLAPPGDRVGNDNGECASMWEACAVGQGAFLHEVGHAFSAPHTTGIMARGYSPDWPQFFLSQTARCVRRQTEGIAPVTKDTQHACHWDVRDMLRFCNLAHFQLPGDVPRTTEAPLITLNDDDDEDFPRLNITCSAGVAQVRFNGKLDTSASVSNPTQSIRYTLAELEARFDTGSPLELEVIAMNGLQRSADAWRIFRDEKSPVRVPGTNIRLLKKSIGEDGSSDDAWHWTVMLKKRDRDGRLIPASKIDLRVGCALDGAVVYYKDGTTVPCGPRGKHGQDPDMGGHQARKVALRKGVEVTKIAVTYYPDNYYLAGLRMWFSDGRAMGALNKHEGTKLEYLTEPDPNQKIVGFFGTSAVHGMCRKFGIVTAPIDAELPDTVYDMEELQNNPPGHRAKRQRLVSANDAPV